MGMQFAELRLKLRLKLKFMTLFYIIIVLLAAVVLNIIWEKLTNEDEQEYTEPDEEPESESLPMVSNEDNPIATTTPRRQTSLDDTTPLTQKIKPLLEELGFQYEEHENGDILFSYEGYTFVCQHTSDPGIINQNTIQKQKTTGVNATQTAGHICKTIQRKTGGLARNCPKGQFLIPSP